MTAREANDKGYRIGNYSFEEDGYVKTCWLMPLIDRRQQEYTSLQRVVTLLLTGIQDYKWMKMVNLL